MPSQTSGQVCVCVCVCVCLCVCVVLNGDRVRACREREGEGCDLIKELLPELIGTHRGVRCRVVRLKVHEQCLRAGVGHSGVRNH
jgi:hypothetical protein